MRSPPGAVLAMVLVCLLVAGLLSLALIQLVVVQQRQTHWAAQQQQSFWLAEAGVQRALKRLAESPDYTGETWTIPATVLGGSQGGAVTIRVTPVTEPREARRIQVEARFPDTPVRRAVCQREAVVEVSKP